MQDKLVTQGKFGCFFVSKKTAGPKKTPRGFIQTPPNGICIPSGGLPPNFETFSLYLLFSDVWIYRRLESSSMIYGRVHEKGSLVTCPPMKHSECKGQNGLPPNWLLSMWWRDCFIARHPTHPQVIYFLKGVFDWFCFLVCLFNKIPSYVYIYIYISCIYNYLHIYM